MPVLFFLLTYSIVCKTLVALIDSRKGQTTGDRGASHAKFPKILQCDAEEILKEFLQCKAIGS